MKGTLYEIAEMAAIDASIAIGKMVGMTVGVKVTKVEVTNVEMLAPVIGPEEITAGIYLPITGDVTGAALLIFPKETVFTLCDLLVRREPGTTRKLTELDESALKEVGNIISGNYFTVLSHKLGIKIIEHAPNFSFDMFGAIINQIITKFAQEAKKVLVIEIKFIFTPISLKGYFFLLFQVEEFEAVLGKMGSEI